MSSEQNSDCVSPLSFDESLVTIDRVLRSGALAAKLVCHLTPEPSAEPRDGNTPSHHPDADVVLRLCRERHPLWTEFPERTVRVVVQHLLHDRATMARLRRICEEAPHTIARVLTRISALAPDGSDEDAWWVWHELARRYPSAVDYNYSARQIAGAWKMARRTRRRQDHIGLGGPRPEARRQRRLALAQLAAELALSRSELLRLDIDDYDLFDGTLAFECSGCRSVVRLTPLAQQRSCKWLRFRGHGPGGLFELPQLPEFREVTASASECLDAPARGLAEGCSNSESEDCLEWLCRGQEPIVCAFVLGNLSDTGGDWSSGFIERLTATCGPAADRALTSNERRQCRGRLNRRLSGTGVAMD